MKFLIALAAVAAVAVAVPVQRELIPVAAGPTFVVDEAGSPIAIGPAILETSPISVGPAIVDFEPISVGPAIIESNPISVGPAIIDFPLPDGGAVTAEEEHAIVPAPAVIEPSPVVIGEIPAGASPLVQIIVNVNGAQSSPVAPAPVDNAVVDEVYVPGPVNIVDDFYSPDVILEPVQVVEPIVPGPVNVVDNVVVEPIQVVEPVIVEPVQVAQPVVVEPVIVGTPIIPAPIVLLPADLN